MVRASQRVGVSAALGVGCTGVLTMVCMLAGGIAVMCSGVLQDAVLQDDTLQMDAL